MAPQHPRDDESDGFGLGGSVRIDLAKGGGLGSVGQFGWAGAATTYARLDPAEKMVVLLRPALPLRPAQDLLALLDPLLRGDRGVGAPAMRYRTLGRTGVSVSEIGFGGWAIGGSWGEQREEDSSRRPPPRARPRLQLRRHRRRLRQRPQRADHRPGPEGAEGDGLRGDEDAPFARPLAAHPVLPGRRALLREPPSRERGRAAARARDGADRPAAAAHLDPRLEHATRDRSRSCASCRPRGRSASSASPPPSTTRTASST